MPEDFDAENYSAETPAYTTEQLDLEESQPRSLLMYDPKQVKDMIANKTITVAAGEQYVAYRDMERNGLRHMKPQNVKRALKHGMVTEDQVRDYLSFQKHPVWWTVKDVSKGVFAGARNFAETVAEMGYKQSIYGILRGEGIPEFTKRAFREATGKEMGLLADVLPDLKDITPGEEILPLADIGPEGTLGRISEIGTEFLIPFGTGVKIVKGAKMVPRIINSLPEVVKTAPGVAKFMQYTLSGTLAGAFADGTIDPHGGRLADLLNEHDLLPGFLEFMQTNPDNPESVERLKNIAEGVVIGVALDGFLQCAKWLREATWTKNLYDPMAVSAEMQSKYGLFMEVKPSVAVENVPETTRLANAVGALDEPDISKLTPEELRPPKATAETFDKAFDDFAEIQKSLEEGAEPGTLTDFMEEAGGDVRIVTESLYKNHKKYMDRMRGGVADPKTGTRKTRKQTQEGADKLLTRWAKEAGRTKKSMETMMLGQMRKFGIHTGNLDSVVRAFNQYFIRYADDTAKLAKRVIDPKVATNFEDKLRVLEHIKVLQEMQGQVFGIRSDIGRTLGQYNLDWMATRFDFKKLSRDSLSDLAAHQEAEIDKIIDSFSKAPTHGDRMKIARYTGRNKWLAGALEYMQANLLFDPATQLVNIVGNAGTQILAGLNRHLAVGIHSLSKGDLSQMLELVEYWKGIGTGLHMSFKTKGLKEWAKGGGRKAFYSEDTGRVWKSLASGEGQLDSLVKLEGQAGSGIDEVLKTMRMPRVLALPLAKLIQTPFHLLTAGDELFKNVAYYSELNSLVMRKAREFGKVPGTTAYNEWVEGITKNISPDLHYEAINRARWLTFQDDFGTGTFGKKANELLNTSGGQFVKIAAVPFFKIAYNITKFAGEHSILAPIGRKFKTDWAAGGIKRYEAIGRMATGSAIMMYGMSLYEQGKITGRVPPGQEQAWQNADKQPYSIRVGNKWYAYDRFDPFGMVLAFGADLALAQDIWRYNQNVDEQDQISMVTTALLTLSEPVLNKTWMQGLSDFMDLVTKADRMNPEKFLLRQAEKFVPAATGAAFFQREFGDKTIREAHSLIDVVFKKYAPGKLVAKRHNVYGYPIEQTDRKYFLVKQREMTDPLLVHLHNIEANIKKPDLKIKGKELEPKEYAAFMDILSEMPVKEILTKVMNHPGYQRIQSKGKQKQIMMDVNNRIRQGAEAIYLKRNPEFKQKVIDRLRKDANNILHRTIENDARKALYHQLELSKEIN